MGLGQTVIDAGGQLTVDGIDLVKTSWQVLDLSPLGGPADVDGDDVRLDGVPGARAYRKQVVETSYLLDFHINGERDENDGENTDAYQGLIDNEQYLWDNVLSPPTSGPTRSATWTLPNGSTRSADIHIRMERGAQVGGELDAVLEITVTGTAGRFVADGS